MQLKCVIHHETVYRAMVQCLEKVIIMAFYYFFYCTSRENLVCHLLCGAGPASSPDMHKVLAGVHGTQ